MSDREFENYLTLLGGLLRLDGKQRQAIAEELRSHMEDRLEELMARGASREEAVQQALAEFGDAAGLAGQFVAISWNRKRRWLMRLTTFSVAATLLLAASLAIFWPGRNAGPGAASLVAQDVKGDVKKSAQPSATSDEPTLEEKLNKRIDIDCVDAPLKDVVAYLHESTGIQFVIRLKNLEEAGVGLDSPITRSLKRVRVSTLLEILLDDLELTYVDRDDLLLITTPEDAEATLQIRVYDCRDLLALATPASGRPATTSIPRSPFAIPPQVPQFVPTEVPGGSIRLIPTTPVPAGTVIPATPTVPAPPTIAPGAPRTLVPSSGLTPTPPTRSKPPTADPFLPQLGGAAAPSVEPTTTSGAAAPQSSGGGIGGMGGNGGSTRTPAKPITEHEQRTVELIELVITIVEPHSWNEVGGPGAIDAYNGLVVVAQTADVHKKVERLFDMLREAAGLEVPKTGKVVR